MVILHFDYLNLIYFAFHELTENPLTVFWNYDTQSLLFQQPFKDSLF